MDMDRNRNNKIAFIVLLFLLLLLLFRLLLYIFETSKYGMAFNEEREKIGLPLVKRNWRYSKINGFETLGCCWIIPTKEKDKPYYFNKELIYNRDSLIREVDRYLGTRKFETLDGSIQEALFITYYFADKQWKYVFRGEDKSCQQYSSRGYSCRHNYDLTKAEADSILKLWNIDRELK
jgi:hypothetical protein